jgi:hypothetical protein
VGRKTFGLRSVADALLQSAFHALRQGPRMLTPLGLWFGSAFALWTGLRSGGRTGIWNTLEGRGERALRSTMRRVPMGCSAGTMIYCVYPGCG